MSKPDLDELQKAILILRDVGVVSHYVCPNRYNSCPKTWIKPGDDCTCGADEHNSDVESAYAAAKAIVDDMLVIDALTQKRVLRRKE